MIEELLSNSVAAQLLSELMPNKTPEQWALWLQNNRNQSRRTFYRIPVVKMAGGVFYRSEELAKFAEFEKSRQLGTVKLTGRAAEALRAVGFGEAGGSSTGRRFNPTGLTLAIDDCTKKMFIQLALSDPLMVYRVEIEAAEFLFNELSELLTASKRISQEQPLPPDLGKYETVTDNQDALVMRRVEK